MERNFTGLIVHLCDINNDLIMSDPMYPLIPGICLLSEARYFKVIAMILLNLSCTISDMPPPELMPLFLQKKLQPVGFLLILELMANKPTKSHGTVRV